MMVAPSQMYILGIDAAAENSGKSRSLNSVFRSCESCNLRRTDKGKVLGPEEVQLPLARIAFVGNGLEFFFRA